MSYTNHTANYNLPQYVGTDKPTYLTDFNGAMSAIDAQMKVNADAAGAASTAASTADGKAEAAQTAATSAAQTAQTAQTAATQAAGVAATANTAIEELKAYLDYSSNITHYGNVAQYSAQGGTVQIPYENEGLTVAINEAGTFGKVYGTARFVASGTGAKKIILNVDTGIDIPEDFSIVCSGIVRPWYRTTYESANYVSDVVLTFRTTGKIEIGFSADINGATYLISIFPCSYMFKNFGD